MRITHLIVAAALAATSIGCTHAPNLATPAGFVRLDDSRYDYRATTAEGVVIAVREFDNDPRGDLGFWAGALQARLARAYTPSSVHEVESLAGWQGRQLRFTTTREGRPHGYWATVFVRGGTVYLVEAGGDEAWFVEREGEVMEAILSLRPG